MKTALDALWQCCLGGVMCGGFFAVMFFVALLHSFIGKSKLFKPAHHGRH